MELIIRMLAFVGLLFICLITGILLDELNFWWMHRNAPDYSADIGCHWKQVEDYIEPDRF